MGELCRKVCPLRTTQYQLKRRTGSKKYASPTSGEIVTEAVQTVLRENKRDGYNPTYFTRMAVNAADLKSVCSSLVASQNALSALVAAIDGHPDLLTIEDFIARFGHEWGFADEVID